MLTAMGIWGTLDSPSYRAEGSNMMGLESGNTPLRLSLREKGLTKLLDVVKLLPREELDLQLG